MDYTSTWFEYFCIRAEVEDMEDTFLVAEIQDLWYNEEVEAIVDDFWMNGCNLEASDREVLVVFYALNYVEDCLYIMEEEEY